MLGIKGRNGGALMPKSLEEKGGRPYSEGYALLLSQEPLPPYELDPMFNNPAMRNRISKVIAKAMEHRFSKPWRIVSFLPPYLPWWWAPRFAPKPYPRSHLGEKNLAEP
jgi:hypothetical protein